jgi:2-haloacid dehalogenase
MKYFLFDIGRVLVNFNTEDFLSEVTTATGRPVDPLSDADLRKIDDVERGAITDEEMVAYLNESKGLAWTVDDLIAAWSRMFSINDTGRTLFLNAIKAGVPVYTLSNIANHHMQAIENNWNGFFNGTSGQFLSYQIGARKPEPTIYRHTLEKLGASGEECFFIDDRPENVEAACAEGIQAHQFIPENHAAILKAARALFDFE